MRYSAPMLVCWLYGVASRGSGRKIEGAMPAADEINGPPPAPWKRFAAKFPFATCSNPLTPFSSMARFRFARISRS